MIAVLFAALLSAAGMTATLVEGTVTASGQPLAVGATLQPGDTVETQAGARVEIALPGGSLLRLGEGSRLTLSPGITEQAFSARLFFGNLWTKVHKLLAGESYAIETQNGVAGVRGTEFRVEVAEAQPDLLRVYEGAVQVDGRDGRWSHGVEPGHELRFAREAEPPRPFDPAAEQGHRFMDWVRSRRMNDGEEPGRVHRAVREPEERLQKRREHRRERR
jgi:ferric-dicitrate binding protein FerR (iron transport regulator)